MKIKVLGSGSAFTMNNYQSNFLVTSNGERPSNILIDCGSDIRFSLKDQGMDYKNIDNVYISHLHADHAGGLEYLAFCSYFSQNRGKIGLYCQSHLMRDLWEHTLSGGLSSVEGAQNELEDYFHIHPMYINKPICVDGLRLQLVQTVHIMNGYGIVPTFGVLVTDTVYNNSGGKMRTVYFTTDTQFAPDQIGCFYDKADIIIHDCETAPLQSKVHAHFDKLKTLPYEVRQKMYLTHYQEERDCEGFAGFLKKGQELII